MRLTLPRSSCTAHSAPKPVARLTTLLLVATARPIRRTERAYATIDVVGEPDDAVAAREHRREGQYARAEGDAPGAHVQPLEPDQAGDHDGTAGQDGELLDLAIRHVVGSVVRRRGRRGNRRRGRSRGRLARRVRAPA